MANSINEFHVIFLWLRSISVSVCVSVCVCVGDVGKVILEMLELEIVKIEITQIVGLF